MARWGLPAPGGPSRWGTEHQEPGGSGQTSVIGVVLIVGLVLTSGVLISITGATLLDEYQQRIEGESSTNTIEQVDTTLSSVSSVEGEARQELNFGDTDPGQSEVRSDGQVEIAVNKNDTCTAQVDMGSIRIEQDNGHEVIYEGGGIWEKPPGANGSVMHTPPDLKFKDGILSLTVVNVTGEIGGSTALVHENVTASENDTAHVRDTLFQGTCRRPDNVTIRVSSDNYQAWDSYLEGEINASTHTVYNGNDTVEVYLEQEKLPRETDDYLNDVVDFNDSSFNDVELTNTSVKVNKSANNTYTAIVTPLETGSTRVGAIRSVESDIVYRAPMDVVFLLDESGSMGNDPDGDGDSRMDEAKDASKSFISEMNNSFDRAAVASFNTTGHIWVNENGEYLTDDYSDSTGVNETIDGLDANGGTDIAPGIRKGDTVLGLESNSSREKVIVLLSDGENNDDSDPECGPSASTACLNQKAFDMAEEASKNGVTIHAIGMSGADNHTVSTIANITGGSYRYVQDSEDLSEVFVELFAEISESNQIVKDPVVFKLEKGSVTFTAQVDGETSHIAEISDGSPNLNDPLLPSQYSFSFNVSDGENVTTVAEEYGCDEWTRTDIVHTNQTTGKEYFEVRCTSINETDVTTIDSANTSIYIDGDNVSSVLDEPRDWWEADLQNETLAPLLADDNETLSMKSNEALFVFRYPREDAGSDLLIAKYRIGLSRYDAVPRYIFDISVRQLVIE